MNVLEKIQTILTSLTVNKIMVIYYHQMFPDDSEAANTY